ncbi:uncharacterized protein STEHIDRAFT_106585 [Stereum hirsutum FP-91666 SS1]|uniref:uncharacterized protein n=1 Tax=Stereum hirsutum (strain FP-91666) TaxID=721885 RepID=UPI000440B468|nr:uncharacterized protein STEHIDRAFT_106585 [Stereum hirsutum FP-91666 SS1]EIM91901.1 hypothetical protein STEHIDRAFT_106585 [Stereum hirsutum FP-91666 SS1]
MFTKPTVTSTAVVAGRLRLRFRGLFQKVHAIQDISTQAYEVPVIPRPVQRAFLQSADKAAAKSGSSALGLPTTPRRPQLSSDFEESAFSSYAKTDNGLDGDELNNVGTGHRDVRPFEVFVDGGLDVDECEEWGYQGMEDLVCGTLRCGLLWPSKD